MEATCMVWVHTNTSYSIGSNEARQWLCLGSHLEEPSYPKAAYQQHFSIQRSVLPIWNNRLWILLHQLDISISNNNKSAGKTKVILGIEIGSENKNKYLITSTNVKLLQVLAASSYTTNGIITNAWTVHQVKSLQELAPSAYFRECYITYLLAVQQGQLREAPTEQADKKLIQW